MMPHPMDWIRKDQKCNRRPVAFTLRSMTDTNTAQVAENSNMPAVMPQNYTWMHVNKCVLLTVKSSFVILVSATR